MLLKSKMILRVQQSGHLQTPVTLGFDGFVIIHALTFNTRFPPDIAVPNTFKQPFHLAPIIRLAS